MFTEVALRPIILPVLIEMKHFSNLKVAGTVVSISLHLQEYMFILYNTLLMLLLVYLVLTLIICGLAVVDTLSLVGLLFLFSEPRKQYEVFIFKA